MIDIYEFVEQCKEQEMSAYEAQLEYGRLVAEAHEQFIEDYENDPGVQYGWYQQDIIDSYRMER